MPLSKDLREFIECLNSNGVEYLVVGALAVSWQGFSRYSADIDFLVRPSAENAEMVLRAIGQFGLGSLDISADDLTAPGRVIQLGCEPNRIDLLTAVTGVTFEEAWAERSAGQIDGVPVVFIGRAALLRNKEATGRPKDRIDAEELRKQGRLKQSICDETFHLDGAVGSQQTHGDFRRAMTAGGSSTSDHTNLSRSVNGVEA